jgi:hypothetical protein
MTANTDLAVELRALARTLERELAQAREAALEEAAKAINARMLALSSDPEVCYMEQETGAYITRRGWQEHLEALDDAEELVRALKNKTSAAQPAEVDEWNMPLDHSRLELGKPCYRCGKIIIAPLSHVCDQKRRQGKPKEHTAGQPTDTGLPAPAAPTAPQVPEAARLGGAPSAHRPSGGSLEASITPAAAALDPVAVPRSLLHSARVERRANRSRRRDGVQVTDFPYRSPTVRAPFRYPADTAKSLAEECRLRMRHDKGARMGNLLGRLRKFLLKGVRNG